MAELATVNAAQTNERERRHVARAVSQRLPLWRHFQPGQLLELSGTRPGKLSTVARLVAQAQAESEPVAWVMGRAEASFYPPDLERLGVDLAALVMVRMPLEKDARSHGLVRAAELLLRSGAFGLVVVDFGSTPLPRSELAWQARLSGLARRHAARAVLMTATPREAPSLGPLVALRIEVVASRDEGRVVLQPRVLKNKLGCASALISPDVRGLPVGAR